MTFRARRGSHGFRDRYYREDDVSSQTKGEGRTSIRRALPASSTRQGPLIRSQYRPPFQTPILTRSLVSPRDLPWRSAGWMAGLHRRRPVLLNGVHHPALVTTRAEPLGGRAPSGPRDERSAASVSTAAVAPQCVPADAVGVARPMHVARCGSRRIGLNRSATQGRARRVAELQESCAQRAEGSLRPGAYRLRCDRIAATSGGGRPSFRSSSCRKPTTSSINSAYAHGEEIIDGTFSLSVPRSVAAMFRVAHPRATRATRLK